MQGQDPNNPKKREKQNIRGSDILIILKTQLSNFMIEVKIMSLESNESGQQFS